MAAAHLGLASPSCHPHHFAVPSAARVVCCSPQDNTVIVVVSDNGGPLDHSTNYPLRGGKGSDWEGGVRVESFVVSPLLPASVRGTTWSGMAHSSDWYTTMVEGIAGAQLPAKTGNRPPDGFNLWPALRGENLTSPRTEVIHTVQNQYFNKSLGDDGVAAGRFGDFKIIIGMSCSSHNVWSAWPEPANHTVPFGLTSGWVEAGTDHARAGLLPSLSTAPVGSGVGADPLCKNGIPADYHNHSDIVCCSKSCGVCGVQTECQKNTTSHPDCPCMHRDGGAEACCVSNILAAHNMCADNDAPCVVNYAPEGCLYNVVEDVAEKHNLATDPSYAALFQELARRLQARGETGPPLSVAFPSEVGMKNKTAANITCANEEKYGFLEPIDWKD